MKSIKSSFEKYQESPRLHSSSLYMTAKLNSGPPKGRVIEIFGQEASGKTYVALDLGVQGLREYKKAILRFYDCEFAFTHDFIKPHINKPYMDRFFLHQNNVAEQVLPEIEKNMKKDIEKGFIPIVIVDSIAALATDAEMGMEEYERKANFDFQKFMGLFLKKNIGTNIRHGWLILINQVRTEISMNKFVKEHPDGIVTPGGKAIRFYASLRLYLKAMSKSKMKKEFGKKVDSYHGIRVKIEKTKFGRKTTFYMKVNEDLLLDAHHGLDELLTEAGVIISRQKGLYSLRNKPDKKYRWNQLCQMLLTDKNKPKVLKALGLQ